MAPTILRFQNLPRWGHCPAQGTFAPPLELQGNTNEDVFTEFRLATHLLLLTLHKYSTRRGSEVGAANSIVQCALINTQQSHNDNGARRRGGLARFASNRGIARHLRPLFRFSLRFVAAVLGGGLLSYLILRAGPAVVWKQLQAVGWGVVIILILGGISQFIKTCAWRQAFTCNVSRLSWRRSFAGQLISDGIGQFGVAGKVVGEGMRISLVRRAVPLPNALSAGAIDGGLHAFTAVLVTVSGIAATLVLAPLPPAWRAYALLLVAGLIAIVTLATVSLTRRWRLIGNAIRAMGRLPGIGKWVSGKQPIIDSAEDHLLSFQGEAPAAFWATLLLNLLWHVLTVLEVFIILRFMGSRIALGGAFVVEGLTKVINLVGAFNPGNFGTYEGGNMLIAKIFGVTGTAGLTLALCRRVRILFWSGIGVLCMALIKRADEARLQATEAASDDDAGILTAGIRNRD